MEPQQHRQLAVDLFNHVWTLLELPERTREPKDLARGEWQVSRAYAEVGRPEPALHHARRCLEILEESGDGEDWDVPFAHEALARAFLVAGDGQAAEHHLAVARELGGAIADEEDREHLERELSKLAEP